MNKAIIELSFDINNKPHSLMITCEDSKCSKYATTLVSEVLEQAMVLITRLKMLGEEENEKTKRS